VSTGSHLKLNNSYANDTKFQVKVFNLSGEVVVQSEILFYNESNINFGALTIKNIPVDPELDTTAPVITLNGLSSIRLNVGDSYTELGATAIDETDGVISVNTTGTVDTSVVKSYVITYTATDIAGNEATKIRTVMVIVVDIKEPTRMERQISADIDDAEEDVSDGGMYMDSSDLEMVEESQTQIVGIRFRNLTIPPYALITKAYLQFTADESNSESTTLNINGEKSANASAFVDSSHNISAREKTNASVTWSPSAWISGASGAAQKTEDLKTLVQEIVDNQEWRSGNAMAFIISGSGKRVAVSFDNPEKAAKLYVEYLLVEDGVDRVPPAILLTGDKNVNLFLGETYTELGATANDNVDGVREVSIEGTVNTAIAGLYTLTYSAFDTSGNLAELTRTVHVQIEGSSKLVRGPYLQQGSSNSIIVRWRTTDSASSKVNYGLTPENLNFVASDSTLTTNHEVKLSNLTPNTRYYYAVGDSVMFVDSGVEVYFTTAPVLDSIQSTRMWVIGDSGTANQNAKNVYNAYRNFTANRNTDLWLMLGDNAYDDGTDSEYQAGVFDMYPELLKQTTVWSTIGNHDERTANTYFDIFTLPEQGEVGGESSGTENYYSFNHANIHVVVLDSVISNRSSTGAMVEWLKKDLQGNTSQWLIAIWHYPPYSKGSHDTDGSSTYAAIRANFLPLLESYGVDFVLTGHSHSYERSKFIKGHYGVSSTFNSSHVVQRGDGAVVGDGAYLKDKDAISDGTVYTVAGASGKVSGGSLDHPAMEISASQLGSVVIDVNNTVLDVKYLTDDGLIFDSFRISKENNL
jgi:hypothetical protein